MYQNLAKLLRDSGQPKEAEKAYGKGLAIREKLATDFPQVDRHVWDLAVCYIDAGHLLQDNKRYNEAAKIYERTANSLRHVRHNSPNKPNIAPSSAVFTITSAGCWRVAAG